MLETSLIGRRRPPPAIPSFICKLLTIGAAALALAACHHHDRHTDYPGGSSAPPNYPVSGSIVGLDAAGLILQNNGGEEQSIAANASAFRFAGVIPAGGSYDVTVSAQPPGLTCIISNGTGTNITAAVSNVGVSCSPITYPIAGTITGLGGATGLVLQNDGGDDLSVPANMSSFQFTTWVRLGGDYNVTVASQPDGLTCTVSHGAGTDISAPVTDVSVACDPITYTVAGAISGLSTSGLILQNNGGDALTVNASASAFQFATPIAAGGGYNVTVLSQPTGLTCTVNNGAASPINADVTSVQITCSTSLFTVGGSVTSLTGSGLVLQNNGADNSSITAGATSFEFATPLAFGAYSNVTVQSQPVGQICTVSNGSSIINGNVTNVAIVCADIITYTLTPSAGANGTISPNSPLSVNDGQSQGFTATPDAGWAIDQWLVDGSAVQSGGSVYTLSNVTANHTVQVTFATATLASSVSSLALATSSSARQITVTNTGSIAATNVIVNYPTWPTGTLANSTCGSTLAAAASCTITATPGATATSNCGTGIAPTSDAITVSADDASTTQVDVTVLTYGCIDQGGYLAVIDDTTPTTGSIGGVIAATTDMSTSLGWSNYFMIAATSTTDGAANTATIIATMGANGGTPYAALACANLPDGGYVDWYLPARDQLVDLYLNLTSSGVSGSPSPANIYWSSTETAPVNAWTVSAGNIAEVDVHSVNSVRCARTIN